MSIFEKMVEYFITLNKKMKRWQRAVSLLSAVVVFTTTYALILPAITLDKNTADEQPGIEVAASENNADESGTVYDSAPEEAPAEEAEPEVSEDNASEGGQQEDAEVAGQDEAEENAQAETDSADTAAPAENAESAETNETTDDVATAGTTVEEIAAETGKSVDEIKLITEDTQLIYRGDDYVVYADFGESAKLPVGVQLDVREITKESNPEAYQAYYDKALSQMQDKYDENTQLSFARFYDITFKYEGMEVEPSGNVNVRIEYKQAVEEEKTENVDTVHFDKRNDEQAEVIDSNTKGSETSVEAVEFEADQFSVYGVVGSATIEKTVLASDGNNYNISVSYGPDAGVPEGAELKVEEIADRSKEYNEYLTQTEDTLGWEAGTATYARFFDITIVDENGDKVDIQAPVDVKIELADKEDSGESNLQVVHFGKETEVVEASTEGSAVSFAANGFSVYAVVEEGDTTEFARLKVNFYGEDRETPIETLYVKNSDKSASEEDFALIVYDPGVGDLTSANSHFKGWAIETKDYTEETEALDIDGVRSRIKSMGTFKEGDELNIYGVILNTYTIKYLDETSTESEEISLKTDTIKIPVYIEEHPEYTVDAAYTPRHQDDVFMGWEAINGADKISPKEGERPSDNIYQNGTAVTVSGDVTFGASVPTGHWLSFEGNGRGSSYTPPQFVRSTQVTIKPDDPTRQGYRFDGWYENPACTGSPFTFGGALGESKTLYAKWTALSTAKYQVIIWQQNLDGESYDFAESIELSGTVNTEINTVIARGSGNDRYARVNGQDKRYGGFHLKEFDSGKTIAPEGTTVVNVYYDRNEHTLTFYDGGRLVKTITALYGQSIKDNFPIPGYKNDRWNPSYDPIWKEVMVLIDTMPDRDVRFNRDSASFSAKTMNYYVEALPGATGTHTYNRRAYSIYNSLEPNYNGVTVEDYLDLEGFTKYAVADPDGNELITQGSPAFYGHYEPTWWGGSSWVKATTVNFYYSRNKYDIIYMDGKYFDRDGVEQDEVSQGEIAKDTGVYYQLDISTYGDKHKPAKSGYTFAGWYKDSTCTQEYDFTTMPSHNVTVYAKWIKTQYRVFLHPNVPEDAVNYQLAQGQSTSFLITAGDKINEGQAIQAISKNYELIGWYTDEACTQPFNFNAFVLNDTTVTEAYDRTGPTELDDRGKPTSTENKDATNNRFWVNKKLNLYAKWRSVLEGSNGIDIVYDANGGTEAPSDNTKYLDQASAAVQAASKAPEGKVFSKWVLQTWNGTKYEDTDLKLLPGNTFIVQKNDAKPMVYEWVNPDDSSDVKVIENPTPGLNPPDATHTEIKKATYTIQLKAEYVDAEDETPTHIYFYANTQDNRQNPIPDVTESNEPKNEKTYKNIKINEAVDILTIDQVLDGSNLYKGYKFLGWAKERTATEPWLKLNSDGTYTVTQGGRVYSSVTKIAADEHNDYENLYAVWEKTYTVTVIKETAEGFKNEPFTFTPNVNGDTNVFQLVGNPDGTTIDGKKYEHQKVFEGIPYNTTVSVRETLDENYNTTVKYSVVNTRDGHDRSDIVINNGENILVDGDVTITFKNERKKGKLKLFKHFDVQELYLDGPAMQYYTDHLKITVDGPCDDSGTPFHAEYKLSQFDKSKTELHGYEIILENMNVGEYTVRESGQETLIPGYRLTEVTDSAVGDVTYNNTGEARLENHYRGKKGSLSVKKIVEGTVGKNNEFKFIIKNTDLGPIDESGKAKGMYVKDENAEGFTSDRNEAYQFTIKDHTIQDGNIVTKNLPEGTYEIEEITDSSQITGYTLNVTYSSTSVSVKENKESEFTITNKYVRNNVDVDIKKTVSGNDDGAIFTITAAVSDSGTPVTELAEQPAQDQGVTVTDNKNGTLTITLTGGKTAKLKLPEAAKLIVTEAENARYTTTYKVNDGEAGTTAEIASIANGNKVEVINTRKPVKVTVIKNVEGLDTDKAAQFSFTATGLDPASFSLYGEASEGKANSKEFPDVAAGSEISVSEVMAQGVDYFDTKIEISYTNAEGQVVKRDVEGAASGNITLESDTTIKFTNKRNKQKVVIYKVAADDQTIPLGGAEFTLNGNTITSGSEGSTKGYTQEVELAVSADKYDLIETKAPDGYNLPTNKIQITVNSDGVQYQQSDSDANAPQTAEYDPEKGRYIIKVTNNHGDELPMTGGPGTTLYTLGGLMLVIASALMYGFRMRRGERRFR